MLAIVLLFEWVGSNGGSYRNKRPRDKREITEWE
jgi:hypothetical protein